MCYIVFLKMVNNMFIKFLLCGGILLSFAGCSNDENNGLQVFDDYYAQIKSGGNLDCNALTSTAGWVAAGEHQRTSHGAYTYTVKVHDYMLLSGNDFTTFQACSTELESARLVLCDEKNQIINDTRNRQAEMNTRSDTLDVAGYSLSKAQFHYCKDYS
jgi:hypothetical protein